MKDKPKPWFKYDSKDVNVEAYIEEYNDLCVEKYKVLIHFTVWSEPERCVRLSVEITPSKSW